MSRQGEIELTWYNDEEEEVTHTFPAVNDVCPNCEGFGTHLTESIREHAYTPEEFYEAFDEAEDRDQYFQRGGIYDVRCEECKGNKVILVVDEEHLSAEEKALYAQWEECEDRKAQADAECAAERRAERLMGA